MAFYGYWAIILPTVGGVGILIWPRVSSSGASARAATLKVKPGRAEAARDKRILTSMILEVLVWKPYKP